MDWRIRDELISMVDLMPTILEAAGIEVPNTLAGRSLQPLLRGRDRPPWREFLFTEMNFHTANMYQPQRTVRDDRFKLLLDLASPADRAEMELYDLQNDPGETNNLADDPACADRRRRLEIALREWRQRTDDPLLDAARLQRWTEVAAKWIDSAPRLDRGPAPDVARVPPGELELLK
jgi:arylsulfatase A-like enzyme